MQLSHVEAFEAVVREGSFSRAARAMALPTSSVSRAVSRLEDDLGGKLLERTTRRLALTPLGEAFHEHAARALAELAEGERRAHELERDPRGEVRVSIPTDLDDGFFARSVARFVAAHPRIRVACVVDNRFVDLVSERFDLAVRVADVLPDSSLVARSLGRYQAHLVASRAYLARRGAPKSVGELAEHDCVLTHARDGIGRWTLLGPRGPETVVVHGRVVTTDLHVARDLVRGGAGIGVLALAPPDHTAEDEGLVRVLPHHAVEAPGLFLVSPSARRVPPRVTLLRDHLVRAYRAGRRPSPARAR